MDSSNKEVLLLEKIREGDEHAFEIAFLKYYSPMIKYIWKYVRSEALAKEIVQETFTGLWERRSGLDSEGHLRGLLYKMARNKALDYIKHQKIVEQYLEESKSQKKVKKEPDRVKINNDDMLINDVQKAIDCLPPKARQIFKLNRKEGLTYKEIACYLDISVKTVESHMRRVFKKLRNRLSKYAPLFWLVSLY